MKKFVITILIFSNFAFTGSALAHCPLCTAGAGIAALGASWLGVGGAPIGVFIGAFAVALGLWVARIIKRNFMPKQKIALVLFSFATTVFPLMPLMPDYSSIYISFIGSYGSLLNRTYLINLFLVGAVIGGILTFIAPLVNKKIAALRNDKFFPYQGLIINFVLLITAAALLELWL